MLFVLVIEQILDPGGEPDAVTDGPGAEDIEQHIACCLGLRIGQRDLVLTGNGLRLHRRRPRRLLVGKTHGQAWRRDTIEIIVDVSAFAPDVAGDCVDPPGTSQIKTRIDIDAVEAGVDICKAQWCRITIHGRDHFLGRVEDPGSCVERHALDVIVDLANINGWSQIGLGGAVVEARFRDPCSFGLYGEIADIDIAVRKPATGVIR